MANEWNTSYPLDHTLISDVPGEIRKLKDSCKDQFDREHETPVDGDATGAEHSSGSAVAYEGTSTPTNRPDGSTALANNAIDRGRMWLDDNFNPPILKRWTGSAFTESVRGAPQLYASGETVFNTTMTSTASRQELDLSSYVGSGTAIVWLEVSFNGTDGDFYAAWTKGYGTSTFADHTSAACQHGGCVIESDGSLCHAQMCLPTDSSGVIYHAHTRNNVTITIKLIAYISAVGVAS